MNTQPEEPKEQIQHTSIEVIIIGIVTNFLLVIWFFSGNGNYEPVIPIVVTFSSLIIPLFVKYGLSKRIPSWKVVFYGVFLSLIFTAFLMYVKSILDTTPEEIAFKEALSTTSSWVVVSNDDFSESNSKWNVGESRDDFAFHKRYIKNGEYIFQAKSVDTSTSWTESTSVPYNIKDFYVSVDIRKTYGPIESNCGIMFRLKGHGNWYFFRIREDQMYSVSFHKDGREHIRLIAPTKHEVIQKDGKNTLAILARGEKFEFFINGVLVDTLTYDMLQEGGIDMGIQLPDRQGTAECAFDNLIIKVPQQP